MQTNAEILRINKTGMSLDQTLFFAAQPLQTIRYS